MYICNDGCYNPCTPCPSPCNCNTDQVVYTGPANSCMGILYGMTLTEVLNRMNIYSQNRLFGLNSDTIDITEELGSCDRYLRLEVETGDSEPIDVCEALPTIFTADLLQKNAVAQTAYDFMALDNTAEGCQAIKLSPPTGFAITGNTRKSAFGAMEWYTTLALANAAVASGETILLFNDTTDNLTVRDGVDYMGIGTHKVGQIIINASANSNISNIIATGDATFTGSWTCRINCTNVTVLGDANFIGVVSWKGGTFLDNTKSLTLQNSCQLDNVYAERKVDLIGTVKLLNSKIYYTGTNSTALYANNTILNSHTVIHNCHVTATGSAINGISTYSGDPTALVTITDCTAIVVSGHAFYLHAGTSTVGGNIVADSLTGRSTSGHGLLIVSTTPPASTASFCEWMVTNSSGWSATGNGITLINGNIKNCHGFSREASGISSGGSENNSFNNLITECIGESLNANGLKCFRDTYVVGGTFISLKNASTGNPIDLSDPNARTGYFVAGAKTVAKHASAYGIKGTIDITARISGCQFLNQTVLTNVLGIDPLITLRAVAIDAYGNMR